jgi:glycolate oxidase FAD binding subunit
MVSSMANQSTSVAPQTTAELGEILRSAGAAKQSIVLNGNGTKLRMGGPVYAADVVLTTRYLTRVLSYDPRDLTLSVEAGARVADVQAMLAEKGQMLGLDPGWSAAGATIGGTLAANVSGPRRLLYGTARDNVIGMEFAMLDGKKVQSGGMVVKNVAGLDFAKLMIGSFGTLAAIATVNFKVLPIPPEQLVLLFRFAKAEEAVAKCEAIRKGTLQPAALELLNPAAARRVGLDGWCVVMEVGGSSTVLQRYRQELPEGEVMGEELIQKLRDFTGAFVDEHEGGCVVRLSVRLTELLETVREASAPTLARAGNGVVYAHYDRPPEFITNRKWVVEHSPEPMDPKAVLWPSPGDDFGLMQRVKNMFDPHQLLNRGRLYGRI